MSAVVVTIDGKVTVAEAVDKYFLTRHHASFPVTASGQVIGILSLLKSVARGMSKAGD